MSTARLRHILIMNQLSYFCSFLGLVLGSFFYGYWVLQIPGAWVALKIGGTRVFGYGVLLTSLLAIITPIAARYHVMALIGVRIFQGLFLVSYNTASFNGVWLSR